MSSFQKSTFQTQKKKSPFLKSKYENDKEVKVIKEAITTIFDKVISILNNVYSYLKINNMKLAQDINFVVSVIKTKKLYKFQGLDKSFSYDNNNNLSEIKDIIGYLSKFSKKKEFKNTRKNFQTSKFELNEEIHEKFNFAFQNGYYCDYYKIPSYEDFNDTGGIIFDGYYSSDEEDYCSDSFKKKDSIKSIIKKDSRTSFKEKKSSSNSLINISTLNTSLIKENDLYDKSFNIFQYYPQTKNKKNFMTLSYLLLNKFHILNITSDKTLHEFLEEVFIKYTSSTGIYHTERHAIDVLQTLYIYTFKTDVIKILKLGQIDINSLGISALVHDLSHPGYSNDYLIKSNNNLALLYNDSHVLENFHLSQTFNILFDNNKHCNIFKNISNEDYKLMRRRMIELILATDMSNHSKVVCLIKNIIFEKNKDYKRVYDMEEQQNIMNFLLHTADISHCSKNFDISFKWTNLLNEEFWREGDEEKEKKLQIGFLCDRNKADTPRSQASFIKGIIYPTFEILYKSFPVDDIKYYVDNVQNNLEEWIKLTKDKNNNVEKD